MAKPRELICGLMWPESLFITSLMSLFVHVVLLLTREAFSEEPLFLLPIYWQRVGCISSFGFWIFAECKTLLTPSPNFFLLSCRLINLTTAATRWASDVPNQFDRSSLDASWRSRPHISACFKLRCPSGACRGASWVRVALFMALFFLSSQASGAGKSWNRIHTQPQPGRSCDTAVDVYVQQAVLHTFLSQKSKCMCACSYTLFL